MRERWMRGLDLSHWNSITPERVRSAGFEFAIIKATEGVSFRDPSFDDMYIAVKSWNNCHPDKPIHIGCYHYLRATTEAGAKAEANFFIDSIKGLAFDMPVFVDVEELSIFNTGHAEEITRVFCETVEKPDIGQDSTPVLTDGFTVSKIVLPAGLRAGRTKSRLMPSAAYGSSPAAGRSTENALTQTTAILIIRQRFALKA